jgi:hypothetical protein
LVPQHLRAELLPVAVLQVNSAINGGPIVAGGLVWATDWNNDRLHG